MQRELSHELAPTSRRCDGTAIKGAGSNREGPHVEPAGLPRTTWHLGPFTAFRKIEPTRSSESKEGRAPKPKIEGPADLAICRPHEAFSNWKLILVPETAK